MRTAMWVGGADVPGDGAVEVVRNPATEEPIAEVRSASPAQVDAAVEAARAASRWSRTLTRSAGPPTPSPTTPSSAATVWINDPLTDNDAGPFGGTKMSGNARELGPEGLESFRETKHVHLDGRANRKPWWYPYGQEG